MQQRQPQAELICGLLESLVSGWRDGVEMNYTHDVLDSGNWEGQVTNLTLVIGHWSLVIGHGSMGIGIGGQVRMDGKRVPRRSG